MNIWVKSIGAGAAIAVFFLSGKLSEKNTIKKYRIEYIIGVKPDKDSALTFPLSKIIDVLEKRLQAAAYKYKIEKSGGTTIHVSLFDMGDTLSPISILTSNNRVQFRELYNIADAEEMLKTAIGIVQGTNPEPVKKTIGPDKNDSIPKKKSDLAENLEHDSEEQKYSPFSLIEFSTPYLSETGRPIYPAAIGRVKLKDTAATGALFRSEKVRQVTPADLQVRFGEPDKHLHIDLTRGDGLLPLYFVKTRGSPDKAVLENEDISNATQDFDQSGKVEIRLQFNEYGTRKWAAMTRENIDHPLALIIDNTVISAPTVISAIEDGRSSITGSYTVSEASALSDALNSTILPARLSIISCSIKPDKPITKTGKKLIMTLVIFCFISGLSFFIFKTLKTT